MTQEQKAMAYDEALKRAKEINNEKKAQPFDVMLKVFPELRESDDERIKKEIIEYIKTGTYRKDWVAWLEKQGEQSICNIPSREIILAIWDLGNEWKELTKGSISTEYGTQLGYIQKHWQESEYYLKAKQSEQKPTDEMIESLRTEYEKGRDDAIREMQGGQKPADKVEPKFKNGQWIVWQDKCYKVNYNGCGYELVDQNGLSTSLEYGTVDENAHIYDIAKDAKDGDVLSDGTTIFIFKDLLSDGSVMSYCDYDTYSGESEAFCPLSMNLMCSKITPAAKEQRDILFEGMADAGYTFDFEKKELKKIAQKSQRIAAAEAKEALYDKIVVSKDTIRLIIELFISWNGETEAIDIANLPTAVEYICECLYKMN